MSFPKTLSILILFATQTCHQCLFLLNSALKAELFARIRKTFIIFARKLRMMRANTNMSKQEMNKLTSFLVGTMQSAQDVYEAWIKYFNEELLEGLKVE